MALNSPFCADVPLSNYSLTHSLTLSDTSLSAISYQCNTTHTTALVSSVLQQFTSHCQ